MIKGVLAVFGVLTAIGVGGANAETLQPDQAWPPGSRIIQYLNDPAWKQHLVVQALEFDLSVGRDCKEFDGFDEVGVTIIDTVTMGPSDRHPSAGQWVYRYGIDRCGELRHYQVWAGVVPGESSPRSGFLRAGRSLADPVVQTDMLRLLGLPVAYVKSDVDIGTCKDFVVVDTLVLREPNSDGFNFDWQEEWVIRLCGTDVSVVVDFFSDTDTWPGASFKAGFQ